MWPAVPGVPLGDDLGEASRWGRIEGQDRRQQRGPDDDDQPADAEPGADAQAPACAFGVRAGLDRGHLHLGLDGERRRSVVGGSRASGLSDGSGMADPRVEHGVQDVDERR